MAYQPQTNSVVAFQSNPNALVGTVSIVGNIPFNNSSVIAKLTNSSVTALQGTNPWAVGNSSVQVVGELPPQSVSGVGTFNINPVGSGSIIAKLTNSSVTAYQGATPWVITGSIQGGGGGTQYVEDTAQTSVTATAILFRKNDSTSIMGVISPASPLPVQGSVTALQGTNPWVVGSSSIQVVGTVPTTSVIVIPGIGVLGSVAALQGTQHWLTQIVTSVATRPTPASVQLLGGTNAIGSVAAYQGTNPWVVGNSSVLILPGLNVIGSV